MLHKPRRRESATPSQPSPSPIDRAADTLFEALNATYDLVEFAQDAASLMPPATLAELIPAHLDTWLEPNWGAIRTAPGAEEAYARTRDKLRASVTEKAGQRLAEFYAVHRPIFEFFLGTGNLNILTAAKPQAVAWAGIHAPSASAWVVALVFDVADRIRCASGMPSFDLSGGTLRPKDRMAMTERWGALRECLATMHLPGRSEVAAELEGAIAVAIVSSSRQPPAPPHQPPAALRAFPARRSMDCASIAWGTQTFTFSPNQAAVVCLLWDAWENGTPDLLDATLLDKCGIETRRLADIFKLGGGAAHPAWGTMIVSEQKSSHRLQPPPS
jgi:hypothetical protein